LLRKARTFTSGEWATGATVSVWLWFGLLILRQARPGWRSALRAWTILAGFMAAGLVGSALWVARLASTHHMAVVTQSEAVLRLGPFEESQSAATLEDGAELRILDQKDAWLQVTAGERHRGWVHSSAVREIQR
jgi:SH3-like domain-containing protein